MVILILNFLLRDEKIYKKDVFSVNHKSFLDSLSGAPGIKPLGHEVAYVE